MSRPRAPLLALLGVLGLFSLGLSQGWLDRTPPEVYAEVPERAPAGEGFRIFLSASEPVVYTLRYGDLEREAVAQNLELDLTALPGDYVLEVTARDGADNETRVQRPIFGVPEPRPQIQATREARAGDPVSVRVALPPESLVDEIAVTLGGEPLKVFRTDFSAVALGSVPLGAETATQRFEVRLTDAFGRTATAERTLRVLADPRPVEELDIAPSILSASTPENKDLEAAALEDAYRAALSRPLWRAPFLMPVEGRSTSSFGAPRRYAPGGPVSYHQGADLAAPEGTPVRAANGGVVRVAGFYPIKGGLVVLDHGASVYSLYFHQSKLHVRAGQRVKRGERIGEVGTTGLSTGPHLHWEMRVNTLPTNPLEWVGKVLP